MALDLGELAKGRLSYAVREPALDDARWERIRSGFAAHYLVHELGSQRFSFERGEGYLRAGKLDAFALVDSGTVERVREAVPHTEGNVVVFAPLYGWLRFTLDVRTTFLVWIFVLLFAWIGFGGDWLLWLSALVAIILGTVFVIQRSLRRKLRIWTVRESWH